MENKFKQYLDAGRGRTKELADRLGIGSSYVSQVASGNKRVPPSWYREIVDFSGGALTYEDLIPEPSTKQAASA